MAAKDSIPEEYPKVYLYKRIVEAKLFIDKNFAKNIDLGNIAGEAYFSKFHFIRLFKKIYGRTPHQYMTCVRIEEAMKLMKSGCTVSEACFSVGFESISSFSGLFKRITGETPSAYQSRQQAIKAQTKIAPLEFIPGCFSLKDGMKKKSNFGEERK